MMVHPLLQKITRAISQVFLGLCQIFIDYSVSELNAVHIGSYTCSRHLFCFLRNSNDIFPTWNFGILFLLLENIIIRFHIYWIGKWSWCLLKKLISGTRIGTYHLYKVGITLSSFWILNIFASKYRMKLETNWNTL